MVNVALSEAAIAVDAAEVVAESRATVEEAPLSVRSIGTNEIKRNPGGGRDISRALRSLPGVAAIPSFRNDTTAGFGLREAPQGRTHESAKRQNFGIKRMFQDTSVQ